MFYSALALSILPTLLPMSWGGLLRMHDLFNGEPQMRNHCADCLHHSLASLWGWWLC